jgi:hypothetical protein
MGEFRLGVDNVAAAGGGVDAAAACETVIVVPPTVRVPVRAAPVLAATLNWTLPFPLPVAPWVIEMKLALLTAVQAQPDEVVTAMLADPPSAANVVVVCPTANEHVVDGDGAVVVLVPQAAISGNNVTNSPAASRPQLAACALHDFTSVVQEVLTFMVRTLQQLPCLSDRPVCPLFLARRRSTVALVSYIPIWSCPLGHTACRV